MRKRDKKREKAKAEVRDKKRKEVYVDVEIGEGGKRGAGHRQRVSCLIFHLVPHFPLPLPLCERMNGSCGHVTTISDQLLEIAGVTASNWIRAHPPPPPVIKSGSADITDEKGRSATQEGSRA